MNEQPEQQPTQPSEPVVFQPDNAPAAPVAPSQAASPTPTEPVAYEAAPVSPSFQQQNTAAPAASSNTPESWPGAFGAYKYSKVAVRVVLGTLIVFWLITIVMNIVLGAFLKDDLAFVGDIASFLISGIVSVAITIVEISGVRGQKIGVGETVSKSLPMWLPMLGLTILSSLIMGLSLLLLIVPFFFVFPRLILSTYFLVDQKLGVVDSIKASWAATKGNVGKVYGIIGASIAMMLLAVTIIGIPFAVYFLIMYSAAFAVLYEFIRKQQSAGISPSSFQQPVGGIPQQFNN